MLTEKLLTHSVSYVARQFSHLPPTAHVFSAARVNLVPQACVYLSFDFTYQSHSSYKIEGMDLYYSNAKKTSILAHKFASSAFILPYQEHAPLPFQLQLNVSKALECSKDTQTDKIPKNGVYYPYQTPIERIVSHVQQARAIGIECVGVVVDAEFTSKDNLNELYKAKIEVIGRIKKTNIIEYAGERMSIQKLVGLFPFIRCALYPSVGWRSKSVSVTLAGLDQKQVKITIVWRKNKGEWIPFFLISTNMETTTGEVIRSWRKRWQIEVLHRLYKQNFGLPCCQFKSYATHQHHANLVIEAYWLAREERERDRRISWREARRRAGENLKNQLLIGDLEKAA